VKLLVQVAGVAAAGGVLVLALRLAGRRLAPAAGVGVLALALVGAATLLRLPRTVDDLRDSRRNHARLTSAAVEAAGARRYPGLEIDAAFFDWVATRVPPRASFFIVTQPRHQSSYQWGTFRLLPRLATERADQADWIVFYDRDPRNRGPAAYDARTLELYRPGFGIARRAGAP
jgi:hypothetical protein